jgi:hypothetical protein
MRGASLTGVCCVGAKIGTCGGCADLKSVAVDLP